MILIWRQNEQLFIGGVFDEVVLLPVNNLKSSERPVKCVDIGGDLFNDLGRFSAKVPSHRCRAT